MWYPSPSFNTQGKPSVVPFHSAIRIWLPQWMRGMYSHTVESAHISSPMPPCVSLRHRTAESPRLLSNAILISLYKRNWRGNSTQIKRELPNACYYPLEKILPSRMLSKILKLNYRLYCRGKVPYFGRFPNLGRSTFTNKNVPLSCTEPWILKT